MPLLQATVSQTMDASFTRNRSPTSAVVYLTIVPISTSMSQKASHPRQNFAIMGKPTISAAESGKKKIELGAVIDFCNANDISFSKLKLFNFFGVPQATGYMWFPGGSSTNTRRPQQPADISSVSSTSNQSPPAKRQNPVRNGGRDRKRLKSIIDDLAGEASSESSPPPLSSPSSPMASSSPLPEQPLTPPKRKIAQPKRKIGSHPGLQPKQEERIEIKSEMSDDEIEI
jgi:hypothetical protein